MGKVLYYIGTYTWEGSKGIYGTYMDKETKEFTRPELFARTGLTYLYGDQQQQDKAVCGNGDNRQNKGARLRHTSLQPES